jgi:hypothetical protein
MSVEKYCDMLRHSVTSTGISFSKEDTIKPDVCSEEFDLFMEWIVEQIKSEEIDVEFVESIFPSWKRWHDAKIAGVSVPPPIYIRPLTPKRGLWVV